MREYIERTNTLWLLFGIIIASLIVFVAVTAYWDFMLIDEISSPTELRALLVEMSAEQRLVHAVLTSTLDVIFPLALGGFLAGIAFRCFENVGKYLAILPIAAIPVDIIEGVIQVLALIEIYDALQFKAVITPTKIILFSLGIIVAIIAGAKCLIYKFRFN